MASIPQSRNLKRKVEKDNPNRGLDSTQCVRRRRNRNKGGNVPSKQQEFFELHKVSQKIFGINQHTMKQVIRPKIEFEVKINVISELVTSTMHYLAINRITIKETDQQLLERVTTLQIRAKVAFARGTFPCTSSISYEDLTRIKMLLTPVIKSHKLYIDQIGIVEFEKQLFVPRIEESPLEQLPFDKLETNTINKEPTVHVEGDSSNFSDNTLTNKHEFLNLGATIREYTDFIGRIQRKIRGAITNLDFNNLKGGMAQLVGSRLENRNGTKYIETWCSRNVPIFILLIGGDFKFGFESADIIHNEQIACVNYLAYPGFIFSMMQKSLHSIDYNSSDSSDSD